MKTTYADLLLQWIVSVYTEDQSVAAGQIVSADPSLRYTNMMLECKATNKQQQGQLGFS